jgi:hypothetical protein
MDLTVDVSVRFTDGVSGALGETAEVRVVATPRSLSGLGMIEMFLPDTLESSVEFRLEQDSDWSSDPALVSC